MKNQKKFNILGIGLVFIIIIGSWGLTRYLLYNKEREFLSRISRLDISINSKSNNSNADLTIDEIRDVLIKWNDNKDIRVHDPNTNQLTMDEAIDKGINDINDFIKKGVLPSSFKFIDSSWDTYAYLGTKAPIDIYFEDIYSYWIINFSNEDISIEVYQNAYTGQIWKMVAYDFDNDNVNINEINIEQVLKIYSNYLGIPMGSYSKSELGYGSLMSEGSMIMLYYQISDYDKKGNIVVELSLSPN